MGIGRTVPRGGGTQKVLAVPARFVAAVTLAALLLVAAQTHSAVPQPIEIGPAVAAQLASTPAGRPTTVFVTGDTTEAAVDAVHAAGLAPVEVFDRLTMVAASGPAEAVHAVHGRPGVRRVDANPELKLLDDLAHRSTGIAQLRDPAAHPALADIRRANGTPYDGTGVSIAIVDSGFAPAHEQFVEASETKFDVHLRQACVVYRELVQYAAGSDPSPDCSLWLPMTAAGDADASGHGTIVAATAAGYSRRTPGGVKVSGVATGSRLVGLSIGTSSAVYNAVSALNWVLEHHADPCGDGSCPPIRVVSNSYGLVADDDVFSRRFDPSSPMSAVTAALIAEGVIVVFANGNDGGDGSAAQTNFLAINPTPGFLAVGAYHDANVGDLDMLAANFSSRGKRGEIATYPDLVAPGQNIIMGCAPGTQDCVLVEGAGGDGAYGMFSGTSLSAPYAAGAVVLLLEADPSLTPAQVEDVLEDTAHQLGRPDQLEPDVYADYAGNTRGNGDHRTTFDAGHGNIDTVAALAHVLERPARHAPDACPRVASVSFTDPAADTRLVQQPSGPLDLAGHDIVGVTASVEAVPGALSVMVTYRDLPEVATIPMHTTVVVAVDRGGNLGSGLAELDLDRMPTGDSFTVFRGDVTVEGTTDPDADTVTYLIRPATEKVQVRGTLLWTWTATQGITGSGQIDDAAGRCTLWVPKASPYKVLVNRVKQSAARAAPLPTTGASDGSVGVLLIALALAGRRIVRN